MSPRLRRLSQLSRKPSTKAFGARTREQASGLREQRFGFQEFAAVREPFEQFRIRHRGPQEIREPRGERVAAESFPRPAFRIGEIKECRRAQRGLESVLERRKGRPGPPCADVSTTAMQAIHFVRRRGSAIRTARRSAAESRACVPERTVDRRAPRAVTPAAIA